MQLINSKILVTKTTFRNNSVDVVISATYQVADNGLVLKNCTWESGQLLDNHNYYHFWVCKPVRVVANSIV